MFFVEDISISTVFGFTDSVMSLSVFLDVFIFSEDYKYYQLTLIVRCFNLKLIAGVAQLARAQASQAWGRGFESRHPLIFSITLVFFLLSFDLLFNQILDSSPYKPASFSLAQYVIEFIVEKGIINHGSYRSLSLIKFF